VNALMDLSLTVPYSEFTNLQVVEKVKKDIDCLVLPSVQQISMQFYRR